MIHILRLNDKLSTTQKIIIDSVKAFCKSELKPRVIHDYKHEIVDRKVFQQLGFFLHL